MVSKLMASANLIDELDDIGFEVIPTGSIVTLSSEGKVLDITNEFDYEVNNITKSNILSFGDCVKSSSFKLQRLFFNSQC